MNQNFMQASWVVIALFTAANGFAEEKSATSSQRKSWKRSVASIAELGEKPLFRCGGTEPFWSLAIGAKKALFDSPVGKAQYRVTKVSSAAGLVQDFAQIFTVVSGKTVKTVAINQNSTCSDGMSEERYEYQVLMISSTETLFGCCSKE